mmetsp:Transcript_23439/g.51249  ORF Transcript_23439/g.51249 Transcript_23439/m.51249 type:complete len:255 (+) Transcript_23439:311-1075(+)
MSLHLMVAGTLALRKLPHPAAAVGIAQPTSLLGGDGLAPCRLLHPAAAVDVAGGVGLVLAEDGKHHRQHDAREAHREVRPPKEVVLAAQEGGGAQDHLLLPLKPVRVVPVVDADVHDVALEELGVDHPPQLAEVGQRGRAHPHDEVLVVVHLSLVLGAAAAAEAALRGGGADGAAAAQAGDVVEVLRRVPPELRLPVRLPRDVRLIHLEALEVVAVGAVALHEEVVGVVEEAPRHQPARVDQQVLAVLLAVLAL